MSSNKITDLNSELAKMGNYTSNPTPTQKFDKVAGAVADGLGSVAGDVVGAVTGNAVLANAAAYPLNTSSALLEQQYESQGGSPYSGTYGTGTGANYSYGTGNGAYNPFASGSPTGTGNGPNPGGFGQYGNADPFNMQGAINSGNQQGMSSMQQMLQEEEYTHRMDEYFDMLSQLEKDRDNTVQTMIRNT